MTNIVKLAVSNTSPAVPEPPSTLGAMAKAEWRKVAPILMANGTLKPETETLLALYCLAVESAQDAAKIMRKQGRTFKSPAGIKAHPMVRAEAVALQNALKYAEKLGLTPSAKAQKSPGGPASALDY